MLIPQHCQSTVQSKMSRDWQQDRVDDTVGELLHQEFTTGGNGRVTVRQHGEFRVRLCCVWF